MILSRPSLLWVCTSVSGGPQLADHTVSVICSLNLLNIIILVVRHFLSTLRFCQPDVVMLRFASR